MLSHMSAPSSRLVRKEKSRLVKQTMIFGGSAVVLIVVFIFIILPLFIAILNKVISTNPFPEDKQISLQIPMLNAPLTATNSAQLQLTGYAQAGTEVILLLNAKESSSTATADDGAFELNLMLEQGENVVAVFSRDQNSNVSPNSQEYVINLDTENPKIVVDEPQPEARFDRKSRLITVRGLTDAHTKVYVNNRLVFTGVDGTFSSSVSLQDNKNDVKVRAIDEAGNRTEQQITVYLDV